MFKIKNSSERYDVQNLTKEILQMENEHAYPPFFWESTKEVQQNFISAKNKDSEFNFTQKFKELIKPMAGNVGVAFKKPILKKYWFDNFLTTEKNFKEIKDELFAARNLSENCNFNDFYQAWKTTPFTNEEKQKIRATITNSLIKYDDHAIVVDVQKEKITNLKRSIRFINNYYNDYKPVGETVIKYRIKKEMTIDYDSPFFNNLASYTHERYLLLNSNFIENRSDFDTFYHQNMHDFRDDFDKNQKNAAIAESIGINFLYDVKKSDGEDQFLYVLITTTDPIEELAIEKELLKFAEKPVIPLKNSAATATAQQLKMKWSDYLIDVDLHKYLMTKNSLIEKLANTGVSYEEIMEDARKDWKLSLKNNALEQRANGNYQAKEWLEIERNPLYGQDSKKVDDIEILNKVENELQEKLITYQNNVKKTKKWLSISEEDKARLKAEKEARRIEKEWWEKHYAYQAPEVAGKLEHIFGCPNKHNPYANVVIIDFDWDWRTDFEYLNSSLERDNKFISELKKQLTKVEQLKKAVSDNQQEQLVTKHESIKIEDNAIASTSQQFEEKEWWEKHYAYQASEVADKLEHVFGYPNKYNETHQSQDDLPTNTKALIAASDDESERLNIEMEKLNVLKAEKQASLQKKIEQFEQQKIKFAASKMEKTANKKQLKNEKKKNNSKKLAN